jgi:hypothetical protein
VECQIGSGEQRQALEDKQRKKALEEKMGNEIWKMNLIIVVVVCVVFGCLLGIMLQRSNSDVKSGAFSSSVWMKNEKFVTYDKLKCMNEE